jgi:glycosyltransferase involved in cell wall biosynthesis
MDAVKSLSVFFPCFNEQDNIERVVKSTVDCLRPLNIDYEIIIVNDGSKDNTAQVVDALAAGDNRIKAVHHKTNLGYGAALRSGFAAATKDFVFYTDGDGQFDIVQVYG